MQSIMQRPLFVCFQRGSNFHTRAVNGTHNFCGWRILLYHRKVKRKFRPAMTNSSFRVWKIINLNVDRNLQDVSIYDNRCYQYEQRCVNRTHCFSNWVTSNIMWSGITFSDNCQQLLPVGSCVLNIQPALRLAPISPVVTIFNSVRVTDSCYGHMSEEAKFYTFFSKTM
jgi:hypothetical protein